MLVDSAARVGGADWLQQHVGERVCCSGVFFTLLAPAVGCRATVLERGRSLHTSSPCDDHDRLIHRALQKRFLARFCDASDVVCLGLDTN